MIKKVNNLFMAVLFELSLATYLLSTSLILIIVNVYYLLDFLSDISIAMLFVGILQLIYPFTIIEMAIQLLVAAILIFSVNKIYFSKK